MGKFIFDKITDELIGVDGEKTLKIYDFNGLSLGYCKVLITEEENYINYYIIDDVFKQDANNCLDNQDEKDKADLTERYAEMLVLQKHLWLKYGTNEENLSFSIECHKD